MEAENEKDLYDKFRCWGTSTIDTKTKSVQDAEARIKYLNDYISDITGGKITFTMNKDDLAKEYASIHANLLNTTAERKAENAQFAQNQANENEAIAGLGQATNIITKAAPKQSMLLSLRGARSARARLQQAKNLQTALELGDQYLSKANSVFLRRIITGEAQLGAVKGNPAQTDITSAYESRTDGIVKELTKLMETFQTDLKLLQRSELKSLQTYVKKHKNQEEQEEAVKAALAKLAKEKAAREQAKVQSQEEIDDLTAQNTIDKALISNITASLEKKAAEWDKRAEYRQGEMKALGEAIEVLTSDDARDAFQTSATNFLQIASTASQRARLATQVLRSVGGIAKDHRLVILAARFAGDFRHASHNGTNGTIVNPTFDDVLKKIDAMKEKVESEETSDLATKEKCEADMANHTSIKTAKERGIENEESTMSYSTEKIDELNGRIAKVNRSIADIQEQLAAAKKLREAQTAEFKKDKSEDAEAIRLIELATKKITDFYAAQKKEAGFFLQQPLGDTLRSAGGETPWASAEYTGAGSQASGVTEMMKMVADDIRKDILEAEKDESESEEEYQQQKKDLETEEDDLETARSNLRVKRAGRTTDFEKAEDSKDDLQGELKAVVQLMADVKPKCDFYLQNYEVRSRNRLTEVKGLDKAKAILKGSFFEDTDRELKPGDS